MHGLRGLFQGHSATLLRIFPYAAIKFMAYENAHNVSLIHKSLSVGGLYKTTWRPSFLCRQESLRLTFGDLARGHYRVGTISIISGSFSVRTSISGVVSVLFTYPLELLRVRLAFETKSDHPSGRPTLSSTFRTIYNEGSSSQLVDVHHTTSPLPTNSRLLESFPLLKFYRGFSVTLLGMIPYAGTSFLVYGHLRSLLNPSQPGVSPGISSEAKPKPRSKVTHGLFAGAVAGATAQTVSYPFEVVRRRMQVGGLVRPGSWQGFGETVRMIWSRSGWRGFFVGLSIGYLKIVPMTAVSFASWEYCKYLLGV